MSNQNVFAALGLKTTLYKIHEAEAKAPEKPGLYAIYIDSADALQAPFANDLRERGSCLLYIGLASKNLRRRLIQQDLRQSHGTSTFFRSIGAMLGYRPPAGSLRGKKKRSNYKFGDADKKAIIGWINIHLKVRWADYNQMKKLELLRELEDLKKREKYLIRKFTPLMNIAHNRQKSVELQALRRECRDIACRLKQ